MKSRIEHLTRKLQVVNDNLNVIKAMPFCDPQMWRDVMDEYGVLARERTWLNEVRANFPLPISWDDFDEDFFQVKVKIEVPAIEYVSPLSVAQYDPNDPYLSPSFLAKIETIRLPRWRYQLNYLKLRLIDGQSMAGAAVGEEMLRTYVYSSSEMKLLLEGREYANRVLWVLKDAYTLSWSDENGWVRDAVNLRYGARHFPPEHVVQKAVDGDYLLTEIAQRAGKAWPTALKFIVQALLKGQFEISWEPFPVKVKT